MSVIGDNYSSISTKRSIKTIVGKMLHTGLISGHVAIFHLFIDDFTYGMIFNEKS